VDYCGEHFAVSQSSRSTEIRTEKVIGLRSAYPTVSFHAREPLRKQ